MALHRLTVAELLGIMPRAGAQAEIFVEPLNVAMERFQIDTPQRQAWFLANVGHESLDLMHLTENLNYSAPRLAQVWPNRFYLPPDPPNGRTNARSIEHDPERIAGYVYGNRMGNLGPVDGWRFRGRGPLQITGRDMYHRAGIGTGYNLTESPDLVLEPMVGALVAGWVWTVEKHCNPRADADDGEGITLAINGGMNGHADREARHNRAITALA